MLDALNFVADYNTDFGKPGLLHTMRILREQYADLHADEKELFDTFVADVQQLAKQLDNLAV